MKSNKSPSEIVRKLRSEVTFSIIEGLNQFRKNGKIEELTEVISLLNKTSDQEILSLARNLIHDIKTQAAVPCLVSCIEDETYHDIRELLISACWQSGLDFSEHLPVFVRLVREAPYAAAFEALTVIEICTEKASENNISAGLVHTKGSIKNTTEDKIPLFNTLIEVLGDKLESKNLL